MAATDPPDDSTGPTDDPPDAADRPRVPETSLRAAREAVRIERRRVADEREAFEAFRARVRRIPPDTTTADATITGTTARAETTGSGATAPRPDPRTPDAMTAAPGVLPAGSPSPSVASSPSTTGRGLVAVRDAYEETVMSVPHYEAEYNDTYERSLLAEFGPELTAALTREPRLGDRTRSSLLSRTTEAIEQREMLIELVAAEADSLDRAASNLRPVLDELATLSRTDFTAERFGALDGYRARLAVLEDTCDGIAERRQHDRTDAERSVVIGAVPDVQTYLYQELPVTYPVLAAVAEAGDRIGSVRDDVARAMAYDGSPSADRDGY